MHIAQIAPIAERVPPKKYGGTERVIYNLTEELVAMGHDVTLFASGDSITSAHLVATIPTSLRELGKKDIYGNNLDSLTNLGVAYDRQDEFDIIHDHNPHISLPTAQIARVPVAVTWHGPFHQDIRNFFSIFNRPAVIGISKSQTANIVGMNIAGTVYNGLRMEHYPFSEKPDDYLLFVGRMDREKGPHIAIDVAARLKRRLIIAAKADLMVPHIKDYFSRYISPRLKKYKDLVTWVGEVDEEERNKLMSKASCLLHPVTWPEPFGLTMIEAMACGCPVVAFGLGSIPEIVVDGKTGFVVETLHQMLDAVNKVGRINRYLCRERALQNFSAKTMAEGYLAIYQKLVTKK